MLVGPYIFLKRKFEHSLCMLGISRVSGVMENRNENVENWLPRIQMQNIEN